MTTPIPPVNARLARLLAPALLLLAAAFTAQTPVAAQSTIRVIVNDHPITSFEIRQRATMMKVFSRGQQGEQAAIEALIDERLMLEEAKRRGVEVTDAEVDEEFARRARQVNLTAAQFAQAMRQAGFGDKTFKQFLRANMAWNQIIRARFRATEEVTDLDVAAALTEAEPSAETETVQMSEYMLQQIIFFGPEAEARRKAEAFRGGFQGCDNSVAQAAGTPGIVVKPPVRREEGQMADSLKETVASLDVGGISEPEKVAEGIQLIAVCSKQEIAGQTQQAVEIKRELSNERGAMLARRYLRDLRSDASIEYR
jgi:peptidyl-prolyl cis-trans isomerase SurA